jgi:Leucine-rich repeat (LRR) protein
LRRATRIGAADILSRCWAFYKYLPKAQEDKIDISSTINKALLQQRNKILQGHSNALTLADFSRPLPDTMTAKDALRELERWLYIYYTLQARLPCSTRPMYQKASTDILEGIQITLDWANKWDAAITNNDHVAKQTVITYFEQELHAGLYHFYGDSYMALPQRIEALGQGGFKAHRYTDYHDIKYISQAWCTVASQLGDVTNLLIRSFTSRSSTSSICDFLLQNPRAFQNNLRKLEFKYCSLAHIPEQVFECSNLEYLDLSDNCITTISPLISKLPKLKHLQIRNNHLRTIPPELGLIFTPQNSPYIDLTGNPLQYLPPYTPLQHINSHPYSSQELVHQGFSRNARPWQSSTPPKLETGYRIIVAALNGLQGGLWVYLSQKMSRAINRTEQSPYLSDLRYAAAAAVATGWSIGRITYLADQLPSRRHMADTIGCYIPSMATFSLGAAGGLLGRWLTTDQPAMLATKLGLNTPGNFLDRWFITAPSIVKSDHFDIPIAMAALGATAGSMLTAYLDQ